MNRSSLTRREFLQSTTAVAAPLLLPSSLWAAAPGVKPNARITLGFIGVGKQGRHLLNSFLPHGNVQIVAVNDVDTTRRLHHKKLVEEFYSAKGNKDYKGCDEYKDFREVIARKDIDAVVIAAPDHWHAYPTVMAANAKKDIYCEKPLCLTIHEARAMAKAVRKNQRVFQTGSMQRSMSEFYKACSLVRNGRIGQIKEVYVSVGGPSKWCDLPEEPMEPGLDWDFWLGPAPKRPYNSVLSPRGVHDHFPDWRNYWEFGGGMVTDWGAHHLDIAQWGLGMDDSGPVEVLPAPEGTRAKRGVTLVYANGVTVVHKDGFGVHFFGSEGEVQVNRGQFVFTRNGELVSKFTRREDGGSLQSALSKAEKAFMADAKVKLYRSESHTLDFLNCVKDRKQPITSEIVGGHSVICCHLMNLAYYHGEKIKWDPAQNGFAGGTGDPAWLTRDYRSPWKV